MKPVLTPQEASELDRATQDRGVSAADLMERAGRAVARAAVEADVRQAAGGVGADDQLIRHLLGERDELGQRVDSEFPGKQAITKPSYAVKPIGIMSLLTSNGRFSCCAGRIM